MEKRKGTDSERVEMERRKTRPEGSERPGIYSQLRT